jgi:hypothetical protein
VIPEDSANTRQMLSAIRDYATGGLLSLPGATSTDLLNGNTAPAKPVAVARRSATMAGVTSQ